MNSIFTRRILKRPASAVGVSVIFISSTVPLAIKLSLTLNVKIKRYCVQSLCLTGFNVADVIMNQNAPAGCNQLYFR